MNRHKKLAISVFVLITALSIVACGQVEEDETIDVGQSVTNQQESNLQTVENTEAVNDVFKKFEGQWIFDEERGACVGVERTETCAYGVEGSEWTVWVTGGDIISDLDVYGYTENSIIFKTAHDGYDAFYELSFNPANSINFAFGTSLDAMDDVIVCD